MSANPAQRDDDFDDDEGFRPDGVALRVMALVIRKRAALFDSGGEEAVELLACAMDYEAFSAGARGEARRLAAGEEGPRASAEVFFESERALGIMERGLRPAPGVEMRRFLLMMKEEGRDPTAAGWSGGVPSAAFSDAPWTAMAEVIRRPGGSWMALHAEVEQRRRRQGLATLLYDSVEGALGEQLWPSGWLSEDAYAFWRRRRWSAVEGYRRIEPFLRLWISPRELLTLMTIDRAKIEAWLELAGRNAARELH